MNTIDRRIVLGVIERKYDGALRNGLIESIRNSSSEQIPTVEVVTGKVARIYRIRMQSKRGVEIPGGDEAVESLDSYAGERVRIIAVAGATDNYIVFTDIETSHVIGVLAYPAKDQHTENFP
jgi:hypothetical protein